MSAERHHNSLHGNSAVISLRVIPGWSNNIIPSESRIHILRSIIVNRICQIHQLHSAPDTHHSNQTTMLIFNCISALLFVFGELCSAASLEYDVSSQQHAKRETGAIEARMVAASRISKLKKRADHLGLYNSFDLEYIEGGFPGGAIIYLRKTNGQKRRITAARILLLRLFT